jgi:uncharacterized membrane protein
MAHVVTSGHMLPHHDAVSIRHIDIADLRAVLRQGWDDFLAIPTQLVFLCIVYPIIGMFAARVTMGGALLPLLFPLISGLWLVGPVMAAGIYELSRRRELGLPVSWLNAFDVLRSPSFVPIGMIGLLLLALFVLWMFVAAVIFESTVGLTQHPTSIGELLRATFLTAAGWQMLVIGLLAGLCFAIAAMTLTVVSVPMLLDRTQSPTLAIRTSIRVVLHNPVTMTVWGLIVVAVLALGCLPIFVGLAVAMPVLGHATWHLYRRVVV